MLSLVPVASVMALPFPLSLNTQSEILAAFDTGHAVSVSIKLSNCIPESGTPVSQTRGSLHIQAYRLTADGTLAFSDEHFTVSDDGKPIQQFMRYQVYKNGNIRFTTYMYDLPAMTPRGSVFAYQCAINSGMHFYSDYSITHFYSD
ncbi:VirK family protein [Xylella taiwanensis]|uniref:VirK family protein n=1 Tax=Xylella taiwanensis TaxID=1444770 RepID=UPI003CCE3C80